MIVDDIVKHEIDLLRVLNGHEREIARRFDNLKRELVALVANDYGKATLIPAANKVIDAFYDDLADWAEKAQVDLAEYDLERLEAIYVDS